MNLKFFLDFRNRKGGFFYQKQDGEVVLSNASVQAISKAQSAFLGWINVIKLDIILFSNIMEKGGKYLL